MKLEQGNFGVWIITYNRPNELKENIKSLRSSMPDWVPINVISNHSKICDLSEFKDVKVYMNTLRPDESGGHLSRSWNQCYYLGLSKTENILVSQDDVLYKQGWFEKITSTNYGFYSAPFGGICHITSREAFLRIGWWDERFVGIDFEDYDYLTRVFHNYKDKSSVVEQGEEIRTWNDINLSAYWTGEGFRGDGSDRPRGDEKAHHRFNRVWYAKKRGIDVSKVVKCHKDKHWRNYSIAPVIEEIDWYPWFTAKMQSITGLKQSFVNVPYTSHYGHDGYNIK